MSRMALLSSRAWHIPTACQILRSVNIGGVSIAESTLVCSHSSFIWKYLSVSISDLRMLSVHEHAVMLLSFILSVKEMFEFLHILPLMRIH